MLDTRPAQARSADVVRAARYTQLLERDVFRQDTLSLEDEMPYSLRRHAYMDSVIRVMSLLKEWALSIFCLWKKGMDAMKSTDWSHSLSKLKSSLLLTYWK